MEENNAEQPKAPEKKGPSFAETIGKILKIPVNIFIKINNVKLPGGVPLLTLFMYSIMTFSAGLAIMYGIGKKKIVMHNKITALLRLQNPNPVEGQNVVTSTGTMTINQSTSTITLPNMTEKEVDSKIVLVLVRSYDELKNKAQDQEQQITKLKENISLLEGKLSKAESLNNEKSGKTAEQKAADIKQLVKAEVKNSDNTQTPTVKQDDKEIKRLAELYSKMKPDEAIAIIESLNDETIIKIFAKMKARNVAKIFASLDPEKEQLGLAERCSSAVYKSGTNSVIADLP